MRTIVAGLIGGIIFFFWGAIAHMVLGLGDMGMRYGAPHDGVLSALKQDLPEAGIYVLPSLPEEKMADADAVAAFTKTTTGQGYAFIVHAPGGNPGIADMGPNLGKQWVTDTFAALLAAWLLSLLPGGFGQRVAFAAALGVFATVAVLVPFWNWYLFPLDFVLGNLAKHGLGWAIAGAAMAWWLGRGSRPGAQAAIIGH